MIHIEQINGFTYTFSDTYKIRKIGTNEIYEDAMDVLDFQYEETDIPLPPALVWTDPPVEPDETEATV